MLAYLRRRVYMEYAPWATTHKYFLSWQPHSRKSIAMIRHQNTLTMLLASVPTRGIQSPEYLPFGIFSGG